MFCLHALNSYSASEFVDDIRESVVDNRSSTCSKEFSIELIELWCTGAANIRTLCPHPKTG